MSVFVKISMQHDSTSKLRRRLLLTGLAFLLSAATLVATAPLTGTVALAQDDSDLDPEPGKPLTINFDNVELATFVKFISKVTGRNFVFTEKVSGTVSVVSPTPVSADEAYAVFQSVLASQGLTTVDDNVVTRIVSIKDARTSGATVLTDDGSHEGFATRLIPLDYVAAADVVTAVSSIVSKDGAIGAYAGSNTVIISDTSSNISRVATMIEALDVPGHEQMVEVVPLEWADAARVAVQITEILDAGAGTRRTSEKDRSPLSQSVKIVPDERTNALIVMAPAMELRRVRELARNLDQSLPSEEERVHVYYARHADAKDLEITLNSMLGGRRNKSTKGSDPRPASIASPNSVTGVSDEITITADTSTNAIVVNASPQDYRTISTLLEKLDIPRAQVFIEAIIVEATVDNTHALGFDFQVAGDVGDGVGLARANLSNLNNAFVNPAGLAGLVLAATSDKTITLPDGTEVPANVALFQALDESTNISVLSAPNLLTLDNEEAQIVVGQNVPFITGSTADLANINNVFTTVERHDVGIKLKVKPQVTEGDVVILEVDQEVSALVQNRLLDPVVQSVGPTTTIRSAETTVSVRDGRTVVIGGLISDANQNNVSKIPWLGDLPWIGRLFRNEGNSGQKVNLIIFLTPHIVRTPATLEQISEGRRGQFRNYSHTPDRVLPGESVGLVPVPSPVPGSDAVTNKPSYSALPPTPKTPEVEEPVAPAAPIVPAAPAQVAPAPAAQYNNTTPPDAPILQPSVQTPDYRTAPSDEGKPQQFFMNWPNRRNRPPG